MNSSEHVVGGGGGHGTATPDYDEKPHPLPTTENAGQTLSRQGSECSTTPTETASRAGKEVTDAVKHGLEAEAVEEEIAAENATTEAVAEKADGADAEAAAAAAAGDNGGKKRDEPYSLIPHRLKLALCLTVSFMAIISPLSSAVYYPALDTLATDLHVSVSDITLSITTFQIFQAIAPSFVGSFSDNYGRRPAYIFCYIVYLGANIGLALQTSYPALMVLRAVQSAGSSGTVVLGAASAADLCTRAERGKYMAWASLGVTLGPSLGPVIGGLLTQYEGWRSIFWFLGIMSGVFLLFTLLLLPETCRAVVGNTSVPPPRWNRSLLTIIQQRRLKRQGKLSAPSAGVLEPVRRRPNPFTSVRIVFEREAGLVLLYMSLINSGYFICLSTLTSQLASKYGYNSLQIGLCYLPIGLGSLTSRWTAGALLDRNFKRRATLSGLEIVKDKQQTIEDFDIEKARLQVQMPLAYLAVASVITYGWVMDYQTSIAGVIVVLFFSGHFLSGSMTVLNTLVVDTHRESPATAAAASNLTRCLASAGSVAFANPMIERIGIGWTATFVGFVWLVFSPALWAVYYWGFTWRKNLAQKQKEKDAAKDAAAAAQAATAATTVGS